MCVLERVLSWYFGFSVTFTLVYSSTRLVGWVLGEYFDFRFWAWCVVVLAGCLCYSEAWGGR